MSEQLKLFGTKPQPQANGCRITIDQAGLTHGRRRGAERLLAEMVKRGLREEHLRTAASLCLALDAPPGDR
jgi:hypothetical protein